jgi:GPH family glycoside/pentoside/hexuronide:cation symporter
VPEAARPSKGRLVLFAFGDFAFNLYWQSVMLFLLFYYTDGVELPIAVAATIYMVASVWDGIANFLSGVLVDRWQSRIRFGALLAAGAIPLGLTFILTYAPPMRGALGIAGVLIAHMLFRTAYAAVNVAYLAMTARISPFTNDRSLVAGLRMLFGTAAAAVVALGTIPLGHRLLDGPPARAYLGAAVAFAVIGSLILMLVGSTYREQVEDERKRPANVRAALLSVAQNRAFISLNLAMMAMIVAVTVLGKSVLYYFKYLLNDPEAGQLALASMALISGLAIPAWMLLGRMIGLRTLWLLAAGLGIVGLSFFAAVEIRGPGSMQFFLVCMQVVIVGLHFSFWAMLPNTIEYGAKETGLHVEATVFGVASLLQRIGIGVATAILGWSFASSGYVANVHQSAATLSGMRATTALVPLFFLLLSSAAMIFCPIGREKRTP